MKIKTGNRYLSIVLILILKRIILTILTYSFFLSFFNFVKTSLFQIICILMKYLHNHSIKTKVLNTHVFLILFKI